MQILETWPNIKNKIVKISYTWVKSPMKSSLCNNFPPWLLWDGTFDTLLPLIVLSLIPPVFFWPPNWKSHLFSLISVPILFTAVLFHSQGLHNHFHLDRLNQPPPALLLLSDWIPTFPTTCGQPLPHNPQSTLWVSGSKNSTCPKLKPQPLLSLYLCSLKSQGTPWSSKLLPPNLSVLQFVFPYLISH